MFMMPSFGSPLTSASAACDQEFRMVCKGVVKRHSTLKCEQRKTQRWHKRTLEAVSDFFLSAAVRCDQCLPSAFFSVTTILPLRALKELGVNYGWDG